MKRLLLDNKDIIMARLYANYLGYRFRYNPDQNKAYIINSLGEVGVVLKNTKGLRVHFKDVKDPIKPDVVIQGLIKRHKEKFPVLLAKLSNF